MMMNTGAKNEEDGHQQLLRRLDRAGVGFVVAVVAHGVLGDLTGISINP